MKKNNKPKIIYFENLTNSCLLILFSLVLISGCTCMKEAGRCIFGVSTKSLEESRKDAIKKTFNYDYKTAFSKSKASLKEMGCYIYAQDYKNGMIAVYVSSEDTTPVGIFVKEIGSVNTQIEVSGPSSYAKEIIAEKLFAGLEIK